MSHVERQLTAIGTSMYYIVCGTPHPVQRVAGADGAAAESRSQVGRRTGTCSNSADGSPDGSQSIWAAVASRDASAAEHRAAGLEGRLQAAAVDANAARDAAEKAEGSLAALEQEHAALKEEYAAVAEDLTVMARENQVCLLRSPPSDGPSPLTHFWHSCSQIVAA